MLAEARRRPIVAVTATVVSVMLPDVVMRLSAKRVLPLTRFVMVTRVWSAMLSASTRSARARISERDNSAPGGWAACGVMPHGSC